jgi:hypothetical protein
MKISEAQCKMLTEFIGECNHKWGGGLVEQPHGCEITVVICERCRCDKFQKPRTFLTPDDIFRVKEVLEEKGLWREFYNFARNLWLDSISPYQSRFYSDEQALSRWLFGKDEDEDYRFCGLVSNFLENTE